VCICKYLYEDGRPLRYTLTCAGIADDKDGVPDLDQFLQLYHFQNKVVLSLKTQVLGKAKGSRITLANHVHNKLCTYVCT